MKLIQYAVASIVDVNTGGSLARHVSSIDTRAAEQHAHAIRARSIIAFGRGIVDSIKSAIARQRERIEARRALNELLKLSDRHLADIGLARGDLIAVKLGATTLAALSGERETRRKVRSVQRVKRLEARAAAENDDGLVAVKCA